ncbi:MAG: hypothetical protein FWH05_01310 [Oscillospiraceae bacterium]|nr:hypothetical protein [Oscillospiraceae bacterium]
MRAKEYLEQVIGIDMVTNALREQQRLLRTAGPGSVRLDGVGRSTSPGDPTANTVVRISILQERIDEHERLANELKIKLLDDLMKIPNKTHSAVLINRYINGKSWEEIALIMGYNCDYARKSLHKNAVRSFDKYLANS